jgi:hypothetical protein
MPVTLTGTGIGLDVEDVGALGGELLDPPVRFWRWTAWAVPLRLADAEDGFLKRCSGAVPV